MNRPPSIKRTVQIGWRLDAKLISEFRAVCARDRREPSKELEFLIENYLRQLKSGVKEGDVIKPLPDSARGKSSQ
jgi:hypothetical protein